MQCAYLVSNLKKWTAPRSTEVEKLGADKPPYQRDVRLLPETSIAHAMSALPPEADIRAKERTLAPIRLPASVSFRQRDLLILGGNLDNGGPTGIDELRHARRERLKLPSFKSQADAAYWIALSAED